MIFVWAVHKGSFMMEPETVMEVDRITIEPGKRSGQPCIRGLRITVWDVLGWLAAGVKEEQILADYPDLEAADLRAAREFASA